MNRYWLGIGAGALAVFGVGMTGITLGKKGLHELKTVAAAPVAEALRAPLGVLRFRLDGERIGEVRAVNVNSDGSWGSDAVHLMVTLDDAAAADHLKGCGIAGDRMSRPKDDARFRCVSPSDVDDEDLTQIGQVEFQPGDLVRPLYVSSRDRRRLERSDVRSLKANLTSNDGKSVDGQASFDLDVKNGGHQRGTVSIHAGDGRALIDIRDENGKALFQLNANDGGVSLKASDGKGSDLVRLLVGEAK
jgi:hypothetical protein